MLLEFKPDFDHARQHWDAFWRGENQRPAIQAIVPKDGVEPVAKPPYASGRDGNFTPVIDQLLRWAETHEFLCDAIPFFYLEFGADQFATFLGAGMKFPPGIEGNGWVEPFIDDLENADIRFRPESAGWQQIVAFAEALKERCTGKLLIASPTLSANLDALAAVRGTQNLLLDLSLKPEAVHRALRMITDAHADIVNAFARLFEFDTWGSINRHGMYSHGRINVPQCDFSCMISPEMFREFGIPYIREETEHLDAAECHLDGPGAVKHLPALCEIEGVDLIQWVPGAGNEGKDWSGLFRQFDQFGKGQLRGGTIAALRRTWSELSSRKIYWILHGATRDEVLRYLDELGA